MKTGYGYFFPALTVVPPVRNWLGRVACLLVFFLFSVGCPAFAQPPVSEADKLLQEAIYLQERGKFRAALKKIEKVLATDATNLAGQLEKAYVLLAMRNYRQALLQSELTIRTQPFSEELEMAYVNKGNALSYLGSLKEAVVAYSEGIRLFPNGHQLYLNKGLTLVELGQIPEAQQAFEQAVRANPADPESHLAIARLALTRQQRIPALMAYCRFLVLEPEGRRAVKALKQVHELMEEYTERQGDQSLTITLPDSLLVNPDTLAIRQPNDFRVPELALTMVSAIKLSQDGQDLPRVNQFALRFATFCASLKNNQNTGNGFFWEYYAPYFAEMQVVRMVLPFAYISHASDRTKDVRSWIAEHPYEISRFFSWSDIYPWPGVVKENVELRIKN